MIVFTRHTSDTTWHMFDTRSGSATRALCGVVIAAPQEFSERVGDAAVCQECVAVVLVGAEALAEAFDRRRCSGMAMRR